MFLHLQAERGPLAKDREPYLTHQPPFGVRVPSLHFFFITTIMDHEDHRKNMHPNRMIPSGKRLHNYGKSTFFYG